MKPRLYDNTRISAFKTCPRYYYFRHVRHWTTAGKPAPALIFGSAWHAAMDVLWPLLIAGDSSHAAVKTAHDAFVKCWIDEGGPPPDEIDYELEKSMAPRTPGRALDMLLAYAETRASQLADGFDLLHVEKPFIVPLDPNDDNLFYVGKMDKLVKLRGKVTNVDHKTTTAYKKDGGFRAAFLDSFSPNSQVDGYLFAMHMLFPGQVGGVWIDATLVHKTEDYFTVIPVERQMRMLDGWLWETRSWIDNIEANTRALDDVKPDDPYMSAFPKNTNSCFNYAQSCAYLYACKAWPNPIAKDLPPDMEVNEWDPLEHIGKDEILEQLKASKT